MTRKCSKCGDQELIQKPPEIFRHGLPQLKSPLEIDIKFVCPNCDREVTRETHYLAMDIDGYQPGTTKSDDAQENGVVRKHAQVLRNSSNEKLLTALQYLAVYRAGDNVLFPTHEGTIQDGTVIGRYGKPDLVIELAEEYFKQYRAIFPSGRLPNTLIEIMPALHLLVTATELAIKAFLIRSDKSVKTHTLSGLYEDLDCEHRKEIERRFSDSGPNSNLKRLRVDGPTAKNILGMYDNTYSGESSVYMDTRYYAEPTTTTFKQSNDLYGANLVKGNTPYPIFLPVVVRALIDTFRFYSGLERLRRLGGDIQDKFRGSGNNNHGEWGLIPSSLGLVVISVSQRADRDSNNEELEVFRSFKTANPSGFSTSWMYGGNTLLFYSAGGRSHSDGRRVINGLECRVRYKERLGMHSRDMYLLADALDRGSFSELVVD